MTLELGRSCIGNRLPFLGTGICGRWRRGLDPYELDIMPCSFQHRAFYMEAGWERLNKQWPQWEGRGSWQFLQVIQKIGRVFPSSCSGRTQPNGKFLLRILIADSESCTPFASLKSKEKALKAKRKKIFALGQAKSWNTDLRGILSQWSKSTWQYWMTLKTEWAVTNCLAFFGWE